MERSPAMVTMAMMRTITRHMEEEATVAVPVAEVLGEVLPVVEDVVAMIWA